MRIHLLLLLALLLVGMASAANWTINGTQIYWNNSNARIECNAYSNNIWPTPQEQICNFTYTGATAKTTNISLVFNLADGVIPKKAYLWQNISHMLYHIVQTPANHTTAFGNVTSFTATANPCSWGAGSIKRNVTFTNGNSTIYCVDGYINNSGVYTAWSVWNESVSTPYISYFYDWNDVTSAFTVTQVGSYKIGTIEAAWNTNQSRLAKFVYATMPGSSGKFDIAFHTGSAAEAIADPSKVLLKLDPWFTTPTYNYRMMVNCTNIADGTAIYINGSGGFYLNGSWQSVNTKCANETYVYYDDSTHYIVVNGTNLVPFHVISGGVGDYNGTQLFSDAGILDQFDLESNSSTLSSAGRTNYMTLNSYPESCAGLVGNALNFTGTSYTNATLGQPSTGSYTVMMLINFYSLTSSEQSVYDYVPSSVNFNPIIHGSYQTTKIYWQWSSSSYVMSPASTLATDTWYLITASYNDVVSRGFLHVNKNNMSAAESQGGRETSGTPAPWYGRNQYLGGNYLHAIEDQPRVYNRFVNELEINQTYDNLYAVAGFGTLGAVENLSNGSSSTAITVTLNSPANANITNQTSINFNWTVNGSSSGWTSNLSIDGVVVNANVYSANNTAVNFTKAGLTQGLHYWNVTAWNGSTNGTSSTRTFTVYTTAPTVILNSPANGNISNSTTMSFTYTATDNLDPTLTCTLYIDAAPYETDYAVLNNTPQTDTAGPLTYGGHNWQVACVNLGGDVGASPLYNFTVYSLSSSSNTTSQNGAYETTDGYVDFNATLAGATINNYTIHFYYNNTLVATAYGFPSGNTTLYVAAPFTAPLTGSAANVTYRTEYFLNTSGFLVGGNITGNQTVNPWYTSSGYPITKGSPYTIEASNPCTISFPANPANASAAVAYSYYYASGTCGSYWANGTTMNATCAIPPSVVNMTAFSIQPSHANGPLFVDYNLTRTYNLTFNKTAESASSKTIAISENLTRDYFVFLVNGTNGSINGAQNMSYIFNISIFDESTLAPLNASAVQGYTVYFPDGTTKFYNVSYSGINYSEVRAYPDFYTASISSFEVYSKIGYTTRSRFMFITATPLNVQQNISVYLLPTASATYSIIKVLNAGVPVQGAYVYIDEYYPSSGFYTNIDQKVTNAYGLAGGFYDIAAYYKFTIYNLSGATLYASSAPEQFVYTSGIYEVTIDLTSYLPPANATPNIWNDVSYSLTPAVTFVNETTNVTFTIFSNASKLLYYGMNITFQNATNITVVFNTTVNSSPSGGTLIYTMNQTGYYYIRTFFKEQGYDEYDPVWGIQFNINMTGLNNVIANLKASRPVSGFAWYFIALCVAMVVAGFVSRYTVAGAGFAAIGVLWIFSIMYAGVQVACIGNAVCLDSIGITSIATVMMLAGAYLGWYA